MYGGEGDDVDVATVATSSNEIFSVIALNP
jgi:hypothetical protein